MCAFASRLMLILSVLGLLSTPAYAGAKMYSGTLTFLSFGNTIVAKGMGETRPSYLTSSYSAVPLGAFCNYKERSMFISMGMSYTGSYYISTFFPAPRSTLAMDCGTETIRQGAPIIGSGTAITSIATGMGKRVHNFQLNAYGLAGTTSGSFRYEPHYLYSVTYVTLANDAGSFQRMGGPGSTAISASDYALFSPLYGSLSGRVGIQPGRKQFGGTMALLGQVTSRGLYTGTYAGYGFGTFGYFPWLFELAGASHRAGTTGQWYQGRAEQTYSDGLRGKGAPVTTPSYVYAIALPWTTGTAYVSALGGVTPTIIERSGYDRRKRNGSGTIQLVSPHLVNWVRPFGGFSTGAIAILRLRFFEAPANVALRVEPEPSSWLMLASGLGLLGVLYRRRC